MSANQPQDKKQLFWEIVRFLCVGGLATLIDYIVFWLFDALIFPACMPSGGFFETLSLVLAVALGFCVGLIFNWIFSVIFVFKNTGEQVEVRSKKAFGTFTAIGVIGLIISEIGTVALVAALPQISLFGSVVLFGTEWKKWIAKAVMTVIVLIWNYIGRKRFIFK